MKDVWLYPLCTLGWLAGLTMWLIPGPQQTAGFQAAVIAALSLIVHQTYKPGGAANDRH